MPTINDMMEMAELLRSKSVVAIEDHCVAVRNRNSSCSKCADVCLAQAITVSKHELTINAGACVGCGACVAACPTAALVSLDPMDEDLAVAIAHAVQQTGTGTAVIACARMASRQLGDLEKFATVPCLGRVGEALLVALASHGVGDIVLVDGTCSTCKYGRVSPEVDVAVENAIDLLEMVNSDVVVVRSSEFPPEILAKDELAVRGAARRGFFTQAGGYAKNVTMTVAEKAVADALHQNQKQKLHTLRDRLGAGKSGKMPTFSPDRNMRLMDALCRIGESNGALDAIAAEGAKASVANLDAEVGAGAKAVGAGASALATPGAGAGAVATPGAGAGVGEGAGEGTPATLGADARVDILAASGPRAIDTRHFGVLDIDAQKCSGCGMCVMFCPTEALKYSTLEEPADEQMRYLEFQAVDCTQCRLCTDVCLRNCMTLSTRVPVGELFDFEPRLIMIPRPKKPAKLFSRNR